MSTPLEAAKDPLEAVCKQCSAQLREASPFLPTPGMGEGKSRIMGLDVLSRTYHVRDVQKTDCPWCTMMFQSARQFTERYKLDPTTSIMTKVETLHKNGPGYVFVSTRLAKDKDERLNKARGDQLEYDGLRVLNVQGDITHNLWGLPPPLNPTPGDNRSMVEARSWLDQCQSDHTDCRTPVSVLPTRVLDLYELEKGQLKVYESQEAKAPFMALSYCWGREQDFLLTQLTQAELSHGFSVSKLPRLLQDACSITRRLGCRYLWIDALCIVQDDEEDKMREISQMQDIFSTALVVISASGADTCESSFLSEARILPKSVATVPVIVIDPDVGQPKSSSWSLRKRTTRTAERIGMISLGKESLFSDYVDLCPSHRRAWTLEERMLPTRLLQFSKAQTTWHCKTAAMADGDLPSSAETNDLLVRVLEPRKLSVAETQEDYIGVHYHQKWWDIVHQYSRLRLTKEKDKLPAIGAIAERLQSHLNSQYIAGLWRERLPADLLWQRARTSQESRFISEIRETATSTRHAERAPSWSWASISAPVENGGVSYRSPHRKRHSLKLSEHDAEVLDVQLELKSDIAPYGQIKSGSITLRACLKRVYPGTLQTRGGEPSTEQDFVLVIRSEQDLADGEIHWLFVQDVTNESVLADDGSVTLLVLWTDTWYMKSKHLPEDYNIEGLVLRPISTLQQGVYNRVGWFRTSIKAAAFTDFRKVIVTLV